MAIWWESLSLASRIFACVAIPATIVLLIQTILMLIGIGADGDGVSDLGIGDSSADADMGDFDPADIHAMDMDALHIFTVRGIIAFFVVFGWVGFVMDGAGIHFGITLPVAIACGFAMMVVLALLLRAVMRLRSGGNLDNKNALGTSGTVYLTVPPARRGTGKVNVLLQGSFVERDAVTDEQDAIPTGAEIVVTGISGQTALVVKRK